MGFAISMAMAKPDASVISTISPFFTLQSKHWTKAPIVACIIVMASGVPGHARLPLPNGRVGHEPLWDELVRPIP
ncbi:neuropeptide FF receptor 1 [Corchorus olitorius]|uniref:Neuropeptide FF receptor 1 n=1 Tax=Corchorus olitorius TaxID=93759 RepID=A0A1R3H7Q0_9ROSI|nr:neuropeptide FF receptor 1 [Corchorus olitorius]